MKRLSFVLALVLAFALPAFAQIQGGTINGKIQDAPFVYARPGFR